MDSRVVEFITALRLAGVRVSIAESLDAMRAMEQAGITDKGLFRAALQTTLVKEHQDAPEFQRLFDLYFGGNPPPLQQPGGDGSLTPEEQQQLQQMLQELLANMTPQQLAQLFQAMMSGQQMSNQEMREMLQGIPMPYPYGSPSEQQSRMTRRALQRMRFDQMEQMLQELLAEMREAGMSEEAIREVQETARQNMQSLAEQIGQQVGQRLLEEMRNQEPRQPSMDDLMDMPFEQVNPNELEDLRGVVMRLAAQLRSRAALRQRRGKTGTLDAKRTIRNNLRFGTVPVYVNYRQRHLKPKITVLVDLSISMRPVASFMLLLIYALQDQISRTRSFAFIEDLTDISPYFAASRSEQAIDEIMRDVRPPYSYATDLGRSLQSLGEGYLDSVDYRTSLIVLGDGRNNHNDPNLAMFEQLRRRARRIVWFNPEPPYMWGRYDPGSLNSDMLEYAEHCDAVHHVSNLRQLVNAIDALFGR